MILTLFSYLIIPGLTFFLARGTGWFTTNFSSIRTAMSRQGEFLLWSLTVGGYFYTALLRLLKLRRRTANVRKETAMFFLAAAMMVLFVLTPYLPGQFPLLAGVHVITALLCSMFFFLCLFLLILEACRRAPGRYRSCLLWLWWAVVFCICAFLLTGIINTAMEICFVLVCTFLCRRLIMLEEKNGSQKPRKSPP